MKPTIISCTSKTHSNIVQSVPTTLFSWYVFLLTTFYDFCASNQICPDKSEILPRYDRGQNLLNKSLYRSPLYIVNSACMESSNLLYKTTLGEIYSSRIQYITRIIIPALTTSMAQV